MAKKPILVSGVQSTGKLHLGNYLGALKNFVELQNSEEYQCYFFIADLHSLTENFEPKEKQAQILDLVSDYFAAGLSPKKSTIFLQSAISAHSELAWILNTLTPFGELRRMTQFKDKSESAPENINVGLFDYPVLMASDVLLYSANVVPVGEDQLQHLELTRTLARKFNTKFGKTFIEPKALMTEVSRLMSLDDPAKKMSKSRPQGCLFLNDSPNQIRMKIRSATTDSHKEIAFDEAKRPGLSNLIRIYTALTNSAPDDVVHRYRGKGYAEFKTNLAELIIEKLAPFQAVKKDLENKTSFLKQILEDGNKKANSVASKKLLEVKKKIGLVI